MNATWVNKTNWQPTGFPESIVRRWRVRREQLASMDSEHTVPLRGNRGHVYVYGSGWAGVWLNSKQPNKSINILRPDFPNLVPMQIGETECTLRLPMTDLDRLLERIGGMRRRQGDPANAERLRPHQFAKGHAA